MVTNRRLWRQHATPMEDAWRQLEEWASSPSVRLIAETDDCCEFLSVVTNRRLWRQHATPMEDAWRQLEEWASSPSVKVISFLPDRRMIELWQDQLWRATDDFLPVFGRMAAHPRITGGRVHDARIAAICIAHGVTELLTRDRDFAHFPELRVRDPLIAA